MSTINVEIDKLGRIVIPVKFRKKLGLQKEDKISISLEEDSLIIRSLKRSCALCGECDGVREDVRICEKCLVILKNLK